MKSLLAFLLSLLCLSGFAQTPFTFTQIPTSTEYIRPRAGAEDWYNNRAVPIPTAASAIDSSVDTYWRFTWEDVQDYTTGAMKYTYLDQKVQFAIDNGKRFNFGIYAMNPGYGATVGGATLNYPLVVHNAMQAEAVFKDAIDNSPYGYNSWCPNWNAPSFRTYYNNMMDAVLAHLKATTYKGIVEYAAVGYIDIRTYGYTGEWTGLNASTNVIPSGGGATYVPPNLIATSANQIQFITDMITKVPDKQLSICIGAVIGNATFGGGVADGAAPPDVGYYVFTHSNSVGRIGLRRDCLGQTNTFIQYLLQSNSTVYLGLHFNTEIMNTYLVAPFNGEPCNCCTNPASGGDPANPGVPYFDLPNQMTFYHMTGFGNGNFNFIGTAPEIARSKDSIRQASKVSGYRLTWNNGGGSTTSPATGGAFDITLRWRNIGVTPVYENWDVVFQLRSGPTIIWSGTSAFHPRLFLPAGSDNIVTDNFTLTGVAAGSYNLYVLVRDPTGYRQPMPIGVTGRNADGSYLLRTGVVVGGTAVVANAGSNQTITSPTSSVSLSGAGSTGTITQYAWTQLSGPNTATLTAPTSVNTNATGLITGTYVFQLSVNAGASTSTVSILVNPAPVIANAGPNQNITSPTSSVNLTGAASTGVITSYAWTRIAGPNTPTIVTPSSVNTSVTGLVTGTYVFQLSVNGGISVSTVSVTVNPAPVVANAGPDQTITLPTSSVTLNGSASVGATTYSWTRISGPNTPSITTPTAVSTTVTGLIAGTYVFQLSINAGASTDQLVITVNPGPVISNAGANQTITVPASSVTLDGSASVGATSYAWTRISGPNTPTIVTPSTVTTSVTGLIQGTYVFQLSINAGASSSQVTITVNPAPPPSSNAGPGQTITLPTSSVTLDGSGSSGYITSYLWTRFSGPNSPTITTPTTVSTTVTGLIQGTYVFQLTLNGTISDTMRVVVNSSAAPATNIFTTQVPTGTVYNDHQPSVGVENGVKFRSSLNGYILGIRFYKPSGLGGTHTGELYSYPGGTRLAQAVFINESPSGWQEVRFSFPVAITAGVTYVAAYFNSVGDYTVNNLYFTSSGVVNSNLTALQSGVDGNNGLFEYVSTPTFPTTSFNQPNYWIDVVFSVTLPPVYNCQCLIIRRGKGNMYVK